MISSNNTRVSLAKAFVRFLENRKIELLFCIPGGALYPLLEELRGSSIKLVRMGHEQSLIHAAEGYNFVTQTPGVALVTSGPGFTNTLTGLASAAYDHRNIVLITGQVPTHYYGKKSFQDTNIVAISQSVSKFVSQASKGDEAFLLLTKAFLESSTLPFGPSVLAISSNLWNEEISIPQISEEIPERESYISINPEICATISKSKRPLLLIGQGINEPKLQHLLINFAVTHNIPIVGTLLALGAFPANNSLWMGMPGMYGSRRANFAISNCDLLLILGASLNERVTGNPSAFAPHATIIHVDIEKQNLGRFVHTDYEVHALVEPFLKQVNQEIFPKNIVMNERKKQHQKLLDQPNAKQEPGYLAINSYRHEPVKIYQAINEILSREDLVVADCGQNQMWTAQLLDFHLPRQFLTTGGFGSIGFALPAAIGASLANPDRVIWCIIGDGGLTNSLHELGTLSELQANVKVIVINNGGYGMVREAQELFYGQRVLSDIERTWSFAEVANGFGIPARKVYTFNDLEKIFQESRSYGPHLIELIIGDQGVVYPQIPPGGSTDDLIPRL